MMRKITAAIALSGLIALGACGSDDGASTTTAPSESESTTSTADVTTTSAAAVSKTLTKADAGTTVALEQGDRFEVSLEWCPGCGYHWQPQAADSGVVKLEGSRDEAPEQTTPPTVGGTGRQIFTYVVVGAGTTKVELGYIPPGRDAPEDTWSVTITAT